MKSTEFLQAAIEVQAERGKQYDKPSGERSMAATVSAFNCITGSMLEESDGWMFLGLLKLVRQSQNPEKYHHDSALDFVAYASLYAEAASEQCGQKEAQQAEASLHIASNVPADLGEWQEWRKGDIVESMESGYGITNGDSYILIADPEQESGDIRFYDDEGCARIRDADKYRFVSRPTSTAK